jgi:hypothetical protein
MLDKGDVRFSAARNLRTNISGTSDHSGSLMVVPGLPKYKYMHA